MSRMQFISWILNFRQRMNLKRFSLKYSKPKMNKEWKKIDNFTLTSFLLGISGYKRFLGRKYSSII